MGDMKKFEDTFFQHPDNYGFCTFEQFRKNKEKWRPDKEGVLASIAGAGTIFKDQIRKVEYELEGYACKTVEAVQAQARQMGFSEADLVFYPVRRNFLAGKFDILVRIFHKDTVKQKESYA